jgi:hypothetical protein
MATSTKSKTSKRPKRVRKLDKKQTPAQLRVRIAKEALAAVENKKLKAKSDVWLAQNSNREVASKKDIGKDLQEVLQSKTRCEGCALGGLLYAAVTLYDKYEVTENTLELASSSDNLFEYLEGFFESNQLMLIEYSYEGGAGGTKSDAMYYHPDSEQVELAIKFYEQFPDDRERFVAIMLNIIRNEGTFKIQTYVR